MSVLPMASPASPDVSCIIHESAKEYHAKAKEYLSSTGFALVSPRMLSPGTCRHQNRAEGELSPIHQHSALYPEAPLSPRGASLNHEHRPMQYAIP